MSTAAYDAVVLAGGRSRRMRVPDKTSLVLAGVPLLDRVLAAVAAAGTLVVVGEPRPTALDVRWVREEPPGGGPAAALAAALDHVGHDLVVLLAGDLPLVQPGDVDHLLSAVVDDGAVYVDETGNEQWLCSAWRSSALRLSALGAGGSLRGALGDLRIARLATSGRHLDCDTPDDVQRVEEMLR